MVVSLRELFVKSLQVVILGKLFKGLVLVSLCAWRTNLSF